MKNLIKNTILVAVLIFLGLFLVGCEKNNVEPEAIEVTTYSFTGGIDPVSGHIDPTTPKKLISKEVVFKKDIENGYFTKKVKSLSGLKLAFTVEHKYDGVHFTRDYIINQIKEGYMNSPYEYVEGGSEENIEYMLSSLMKSNITESTIYPYSILLIY